MNKIDYKKFKIFMFIFLVLLFTVSISSYKTTIGLVEEEKKSIFYIESLMPIDNITINSDADFITYGFEGNGSEINPYRIENYNVTTTNTRGIFVHQTTKHFIIKNCFVDATNDGILITTVDPGTATIMNCTIVDNANNGIEITFSEETRIVNNTLIGNNLGIYVRESGFSNISKNIVKQNQGSRLISLLNSPSCVVDNNKIYGNIYEDCFWMKDSFDSNFTNNIMYNGGVKIMQDTVGEYYDYNFENNLINEKPLGIFFNLNSVNINSISYGQIMLFNSTNVLISNQDISNTNIALKVFYSDSVEIDQNSFSYSYNGIEVEESDFITIIDSNFNSDYQGIVFEESYDIQINDNHFLNIEQRAVYGTAINLTINQSPTIEGNSFVKNTYGIELIGEHEAKIIDNYFSLSDEAIILDTCHYSEISNNNFDNDRISIHIYETQNSSINMNKIINTEEIGIFLDQADGIEITFNILFNVSHITGSENYAINIGVNSDNNTIHHNIFINCSTTNPSQAKDAGSGNIWYDEILLEGNFWDDWIGLGSYYIYTDSDPVFDYYPLNDTDHDGIIDTEEFFDYGTNPFNEDSDEDGLGDGEEIIDYGTNPLDNDSDNDLLYDGEEIQEGTDPLDADSDDDQLSDGEEVKYYGTNPLSNDTDGDGMDDYWEIYHGTNATIDDADEDPDEDKLSNIEEYRAGTDPYNADTDGDGYSDKKEIVKGTDPLDALDYPGPPVLAIALGSLFSTLTIGTAIVTMVLWKKGIWIFKK